MISAERYHDFCAGHRVVGHENKCAHIHGHNYRVHFKVVAEDLDSIGRVIDFSVIKSRLCQWLEDNFDHKFLMYKRDPLLEDFKKIVPKDLVVVDFNPTAENIAKYLVNEIAPLRLLGTRCKLVKCVVEETRKCKATYEIEN